MKSATEHHMKAAEHLRQAADHHTQAGQHHERGEHAPAAEHAELARGHLTLAIESADESAKIHANARRDTEHGGH